MVSALAATSRRNHVTRYKLMLISSVHGGGGVKKLDEPIEGHGLLHLQERVSVLILNNESRQS